MKPIIHDIPVKSKYKNNKNDTGLCEHLIRSLQPVQVPLRNSMHAQSALTLANHEISAVEKADGDIAGADAQKKLTLDAQPSLQEARSDYNHGHSQTYHQRGKSQLSNRYGYETLLKTPLYHIVGQGKKKQGCYYEVISNK